LDKDIITEELKMHERTRIYVPHEMKPELEAWLNERGGPRLNSVPSIGSGFSGSVKDSYQHFSVEYSASEGTKPECVIEFLGTEDSMQQELSDLVVSEK
jgi:hypothetical protein